MPDRGRARLTHRPSWSSGFSLDLRIGFRRLWRSRGYTTTVILTFAVCLGANAAVFTIVDQVLLNPLQVPDPSRIMLMANQLPHAGIGGVGETSAPRNYVDRLAGVDVFTHQAMLMPVDRAIGSDQGVAQVRGMAATPSLFPLLRVGPVLGRSFTDAEGEVENRQRILLSHGLWKELFGGDPDAVGGELRVAGLPFTVVGIMPEGFSFMDPAVRFWIPLAFTSGERQNPIAMNYFNIGRLRAGATREQAQAQVDAVNAAFLAEAGRLREVLENAGYHTTVEPLEDVLVRDVRGVLYLLWGGALLVLLIGGINIANLTLAHWQSQARDAATRLALGAGRVRLATALLAESMVVAVSGGALGLVLGWAALRMVGTIRFDRVLITDSPEIDAPVIGFVLGLSILAGAVVGLVSMPHLAKVNLTEAIHSNMRTGTASRYSTWLRKGLVTAQVALAFVLLVAAALLLATFRNLLSVDPGYAVDNIMTAVINVEGNRYTEDASAEGLLDRALEAVRSIPGVDAAGASTIVPLSGRRSAQALIAEDRPIQRDESIVAPTWVQVTPGFFETMGIPVLHGRGFEILDTESGSLERTSGRGVVIVDETLAHLFWPGEDPIGRRVFVPGVRNVLQVSDNTRWLTVVGVVPELLLEELAGRQSAAGTFYTVFGENNPGAFPRRYGLAIRSGVNPDAIMGRVRLELARIDPALPLFDVQTMEQRKAHSLARQRLAMSLAGAFGAVALFLSALGVYGILSYLVGQRTRELGIRIALGSTAAGVFGLVLREAVILVAGGLVIGMAGALVLGPLLESQIFGIQPHNPFLIGMVALVLAAAAIPACVSPSRRAARVDPVVVLNEE
jgi:predicted permease